MIKINKKENNIYHTDNKINDGIYIIKILIIGDEGVGK